MLPRNTFLKASDYDRPELLAVRKEMERLYFKVFNKKVERWGAKYPERVGIFWSRDWEYPWAIINAGAVAGMKVLDCGCGGSPLLPYLAEKGCEAHGVDPYIFRRMSLGMYYADLARSLARGIRNYRRSRPQIVTPGEGGLAAAIASSLSFLRRPNNLWGYLRDPNRLGFDIKLYQESMCRMHFEDDTFDRVFCISVIEHLPLAEARLGMREMARVLKKGGLLLVTVDNDGPHVTPELKGGYRDLIASSGLRLDGEADFTLPGPEDAPGKYNVVGFVLKK